MGRALPADRQLFLRSIFRRKNAKHLLKLRGEVAAGGKPYAPGHLADGDRRVAGKNLSRAFQADVAYEVGGRNAEHRAHLVVELTATHGYTGSQLFHAVRFVGNICLNGSYKLRHERFLFWVHANLLR